MDLFLNATWVVPASVFVAGFIGSPHCVSMCGPIVMNFARTPALNGLYQVGRMLGYVSVGSLLGAFGRTLLSDNQSLWTSAISLSVITVLLVFNGYRSLRGRPLHFQLPRPLQHALRSMRGSLHLRALPQPMTSFIAGLLTVLLPCGHLYTFFLGAVATGSTARGAGFMFAFWLGSTPILSFGSAWIHRRMTNGSARAQKWAGAILVVAALLSVMTFGARTFEQYRLSAASPDASTSNRALRCH